MQNIDTPKTTRDCLLKDIAKYLDEHPTMTSESFGWFAVGDSSLVARLKTGKDITTRKLDKILAYMYNNQ
jgi:hypothetical protein